MTTTENTLPEHDAEFDEAAEIERLRRMPLPELDDLNPVTAYINPGEGYARGLLFQFSAPNLHCRWLPTLRAIIADDKPFNPDEIVVGTQTLPWWICSVIRQWNLGARSDFGYGAKEIWPRYVHQLPQPLLRRLIGIISGQQKSDPIHPRYSLYRPQPSI